MTSSRLSTILSLTSWILPSRTAWAMAARVWGPTLPS